MIRLIVELGQETRGWLLVLAAIALVSSRRTRATPPAGILVFFAVTGCGAMLVLLLIKVGFLAGRYSMPVLPLVAMFAMTGGEALLAGARRLPRAFWERGWTQAALSRRRSAVLVGAIGMVVAAICVPPWFKPLHRFRHGHMEAARWLEEHSAPGAVVFDPTQISAFFANRAGWQAPASVPDPLPVQYAAIDPSIVYRTHDANHQAIARVNAIGRLVARFPQEPGSEKVGIYLFEMDRRPVPPGRKGS